MAGIEERLRLLFNEFAGVDPPDEGWIREQFTPDFLKKVSPEKVRHVLADHLTDHDGAGDALTVLSVADNKITAMLGDTMVITASQTIDLPPRFDFLLLRPPPVSRRGCSAEALLEELRPPRGTVAVGVVGADGSTDIATSGEDAAREMFELGSCSKPLVGTALATVVLDDLVSLSTTLGHIMGTDAGAAADTTLLELATHTSGLPRLAPGSMRPPFWPRDPYRFFSPRRLIRSTRRLSKPTPGSFAYSNYGFALLAHALARVDSTTVKEVIEGRVLQPAGMKTARCQPCSTSDLVAAHGHPVIGARRWHDPNPGAGGIDVSIVDLTRWAEVNLHPEMTSLGDAIRMAQEVHHAGPVEVVGLGWIHERGRIWHNGATGAFQSLVVLEEDHAYAALASHFIGSRYNLNERFDGH